MVLLLSSFSYYPLLPPFRKEDHQQQGTKKEEEEEETWEEPTEVNLDLVHAFESQYALLPVRPDILLLPSDLKPFAKVRQDRGLLRQKGGKWKPVVTMNQTQIPCQWSDHWATTTRRPPTLMRSSVENCKNSVWFQPLVPFSFLCISLIRDIKQILQFQLRQRTLELCAEKISCG